MKFVVRAGPLDHFDDCTIDAHEFANLCPYYAELFAEALGAFRACSDDGGRPGTLRHSARVFYDYPEAGERIYPRAPKIQGATR